MTDSRVVGGCLFAMMLMTLFAIFGGNSFGGIEGTLAGGSGLIINGTESDLELEGSDFVFYIDPIQGAIVIFIVVIGIIAIASINILGSGFGDSGSILMTKFTVFSAFWGILTTYSFPMIVAIPVIGGIGYVVLTIGYVWGAMRDMG